MAMEKITVETKEKNCHLESVVTDLQNVTHLPPASHVKKYEQELNQQLPEIHQVDQMMRVGQ